MNTFDSQHSLDYRDDLLESNPFADTPSRSTELNINTSFISNNSEPPVFEVEEVEEVEEAEEAEEAEQDQVKAEESVSDKEEPLQEQQETPLDTHAGERVLSPMSTLNQVEALTIDIPSPEELVENDTQVTNNNKK